MTRAGWPKIVAYEQGGVEYACPPLNGKPYRLIIKDLEKYEGLARSGLLYSVDHIGLRKPCVDNRLGA